MIYIKHHTFNVYCLTANPKALWKECDYEGDEFAGGSYGERKE